MSPERESRYITAFLRRRFPYMKGWPQDISVAWVQWFMRRTRAIVLYDRGRMVAVCLFRLLDDPKQGSTHCTDTGGRVAYIDITAGCPGSMPLMFQCLRAMVPNADTMAWTRSKYDNRPNAAPMNRMERRLSLRP